MSELLSNLGINWKILVAQIVNFAILLFILKRFLYGPLVKLLKQRREEIINADAKTTEISKRLTDIEATKEQVLADARRDSTALIKKAEAHATAIGEKILADAKTDAERIAREKRIHMEQEREKIRQELVHDLGNTITLAISKSVGDVFDEKGQKQLVTNALQQIASGTSRENI